MNGKEFYKLFLKKIQESTPMELYTGSYSRFTKHVTSIINSIIEKAGYISQNEYYRVDVVGWVSYSDKHKSEGDSVGLRPHIWDLEIAVEHENSIMDWTDELCKLIHIRCPLKVIISYNHYDIRFNDENPKSDRRKLDCALSWMKQVRAFSKDMNEEYLIIIGNAMGKADKRSAYKRYDFRGYSYKYSDDRFMELDIEGSQL